MRRLLPVLPGLALVVAGVALALTHRVGIGDFGWFAYTPLDGGSADSSAGRLLLVTRTELAGWVLVALGLAALTAGAGFLVGRRTRRPPA